MNAFSRYGVILLLTSSLVITACGEKNDDHGHSHDGEAVHQHDDDHGHSHDGGDHSHDATQQATETEAFYAEENESSETSTSKEHSEKSDNDHHHDHEHKEDDHTH